MINAMRLNLLGEELFEPPFTTAEMENSRTESRCEYKISVMYFEDGKSNYPSKAVGLINDQTKGWVISSWDRYGKNTTAGKRVSAYDLVREGRKEMVASGFVFIGFIGIILIIIYLYEISSHW